MGFPDFGGFPGSKKSGGKLVAGIFSRIGENGWGRIGWNISRCCSILGEEISSAEPPEYHRVSMDTSWLFGTKTFWTHLVATLHAVSFCREAGRHFWTSWIQEVSTETWSFRRLGATMINRATSKDPHTSIDYSHFGPHHKKSQNWALLQVQTFKILGAMVGFLAAFSGRISRPIKYKQPEDEDQ